MLFGCARRDLWSTNEHRATISQQAAAQRAEPSVRRECCYARRSQHSAASSPAIHAEPMPTLRSCVHARTTVIGLVDGARLRSERGPLLSPLLVCPTAHSGSTVVTVLDSSACVLVAHLCLCPPLHLCSAHAQRPRERFTRSPHEPATRTHSAGSSDDSCESTHDSRTQQPAPHTVSRCLHQPSVRQPALTEQRSPVQRRPEQTR